MPSAAMRMKKRQLFESLPPVNPGTISSAIQSALEAGLPKLVVLDDDPTGTQTVCGIPVLTEWTVARLEKEFANESPCFYVLTNTRSLAGEEAATLNREIARRLKEAAGGRAFQVVSRSDSTLRGHFPQETDVLCEELGPFDGVLLIPYFEAGGRYTVDDVHYVAEGDALTPASETPFARDASFGYRSSNLRRWVEEKSKGRIPAGSVASLGIDTIRSGDIGVIRKRLENLNNGQMCVVNAAAPSDLERVVAAILQAEREGKRFLFRTGAQFVSTRIGLTEVPTWTPPPEQKSGGLVIVGSHVPKSTAQLECLLRAGRLPAFELDVPRFLRGQSNGVGPLIDSVGECLRAGKSTVVYTSRTLVLGESESSNLAVSRQVSAALVELLRGMEVAPAYVIAKGGITASDLATHGLGVRRAMVKGALLPGVPVWETGVETRFPGLPYVVFPGNVGSDEALLQAVEQFEGPAECCF